MNRIVIGSENPVKIECIKEAFQLVFAGKEFEYRGVAVDTGVDVQPFGEEETLRGAMNRLRSIREKYPDADYWIGIEGGIEKIESTMYAFAWIVIRDQNRIGKARTATFEIPKALRELIEKGYELGDADDMVFNRVNSKHNDGTVGKLTDGIIDRIEFYKHAAILALIPFRKSELFNNL